MVHMVAAARGVVIFFLSASLSCASVWQACQTATLSCLPVAPLLHADRDLPVSADAWAVVASRMWVSGAVARSKL
jgi:hypothetical protein